MNAKHRRKNVIIHFINSRMKKKAREKDKKKISYKPTDNDGIKKKTLKEKRERIS